MGLQSRLKDVFEILEYIFRGYYSRKIYLGYIKILILRVLQAKDMFKALEYIS